MASGYALPHNGVPSHARSYAALSSLSYPTPPASIPEVPDEQRNGDSTGAREGYNKMHSYKLPLKGRVRAESDLGRPAGSPTSSNASQPSLRTELTTAFLLVLPYTLFHGSFAHDDRPESLPEEPQIDALQPIWVYTALLTATILAATGIVGCLAPAANQGGKRRDSFATERWQQAETPSAQALGYRLRLILGISLPIYASLRLSDPFVGLILLAAHASTPVAPSSITQKFFQAKWYWSAFALDVILELSGLTGAGHWHNTLTGYACVLASVVLLPPPQLDTASDGNSTASSRPSLKLGRSSSWPDFVATKSASAITSLSGLSLGITVLTISWLSGMELQLSARSALLSAIGCIGACIALIIGNATSLRSRQKAGVWSALIVGMLGSAFIEHHDPMTIVFHSAAALLLVAGSIIGSSPTKPEKTTVHTGHSSHHYTNVSAFTAFLLSKTRSGSLVHEILCEKDSRRIAYFTFLNFAFMLVQGFYGWISGSLGLLSDTVHMFFDCLALIVGLAASVASKWPTSPEKPYGWSKLNTLAGFGNGVFLMLVSIEFVWGAIEGIMERNELRHVEELLVVSTLGLIVNMIGLLAFGHAHAGHDHGHGHSHHHGHTHAHDHQHSHTFDLVRTPKQTNGGHVHGHSHNHDNGHSDHTQCNGHAHHHDHSRDHVHSNSHSSSSHHHDHSHDHDHEHHNHTPSGSYVSGLAPNDVHMSLYPPTDPTIINPHSGHENENMHGIYLHIAADAGGSLAVIISTTLTLWKPWYLWDPLATIIIAVLIFIAALPLVKESAKKLLLVIPTEYEYELKDALQELTMVRGITGFAVPRFWVEDKEIDSHGHHHGHSHGHSHSHSHGGGQDKSQIKLRGSIHVFAANAADIDETRERVKQFFEDKQMDMVVQVEREGEGRCWCGGGPSSGM